MSDLWTALCLVAVLEGLVLFAFPDAFKRMAEQMRAMESRQLRVAGAIVLVAGLVALYLGRGVASLSSSPRRRGSMDVGCGRGEELAAAAAPPRAGMPARATKPVPAAAAGMTAADPASFPKPGRARSPGR